MFVYPTMIAPASLSFFTVVESIGDLKSLSTRDAALDYIPSTKMLSLMATGIPSIEESGLSNQSQSGLVYFKEFSPVKPLPLSLPRSCHGATQKRSDSRTCLCFLMQLQPAKAR